MDVLPPPVAVQILDHHEICCDACGYSRMGLPADARCPECGEPPPSLALNDMTQGRLVWLRCVACGLVLLVISYVSALKVILVMPVGDDALLALNVPAPKIAGMALVQRSVGNKPGPWGVAGTVAVFGSLAALWLITEPRHSRDTGIISLRAATRWIGLISTGGLLGTLLSYNSLSDYASFVKIALLGCELPVNALLYLYVRQLSREMRDRGAQRLLDWSVWLVPAGMAGCLIAEMMPDITGDSVPLLNILGSPVCGALAIGTGAVATVGIVRLTITFIGQAFSGWLVLGRRALARLPLLIKRMNAGLRSDSQRWHTVVGVVLWMILLPGTVSEELWYSTRHAAGGDVPLVNFPGPKVLLSPAASGHDVSFDPDYRSDTQPSHTILALLPELIAIWLMTSCARGSAAAQTARWLAIVVIGAATGWAIRNSDVASRPAFIFAGIILLGEAPATGLLYWHLADVAKRYSLESSSRLLRRFALLAPMLIATPLLMYPVTLMLGKRRHVLLMAIGGASIMTIELAAGLIALTVLVRFAWGLAMQSVEKREETSPVLIARTS